MYACAVLLYNSIVTEGTGQAEVLYCPYNREPKYLFFMANSALSFMVENAFLQLVTIFFDNVLATITVEKKLFAFITTVSVTFRTYAR